MTPPLRAIEPPIPVRVSDDRVTADLPEGPTDLPLVRLPDPLIEWFDGGRRDMYRRLGEGRGEVGFFAHHLPVLVTHGDDPLFPFTCGNKGVGFVPRPERLGSAIGGYREAMERTRGAPWRESLRARLDAAAGFNFDREAIDYRCLGSLEIFERTTFQNLRRRPLASLLYTGSCPTYTSFQLNCVVEVVGPEDPRHAFLQLSRTLFEYDGFHIAQPRFRHAYLFWITEVVDKTPHRVEEPPEAAPRGAGALPWDPAAEDAIRPIPGLVRRHVREQIEAHAAAQGLDRVTGAFVAEIRRAMRLPEA